MTHLICPNDGTENPSAALLCARCGAKLSRIEAGLTFYNRYHIDQLLGKTETGFDYRARNAITGKPCTLREIVPDVAAQHDDLYRFYEAARHLTQAAPHCLVPTLEYFTYRSRVYLVEESCELTSLREAIDTKGSLSEPLAARLFRRMLAGLSELYSLEPAVYVGAIGPRGVLLSGVEEPVFLESQYVISAVFGKASETPDIKFGKDLYDCAVVAIAALLGEALPSKSCFPVAIATIGNLAFSASLEWILISNESKPESPSQVGQFWELMESAVSELSGGNAAKAVELFSDAYHLSGSPRVEAALNEARKALPEPSIKAPITSIPSSEATPGSAVEVPSLPLEAAVATALLEPPNSAIAEAVPELEPVREVMRAMAASAGHESAGVTELPPVVQQVDHAEPSRSNSSEAAQAMALLELPGPAMAEVVAELEPVREAMQAEAVTASTGNGAASVTERPPVVQEADHHEPSESDSSYEGPPAEPWWTFLLRRKLLVGGCLLLLVVGVGTWVWNRHASEALLVNYDRALDEQRFFAPAANNAHDLRQKAIHDYGDKSALVQSMNQKAQAPLQQWSDAQFRIWREGLDFKLAQWEELSKAEEWLVSMDPTDPAIQAYKDYADAEVHYLRGEYQEANDGFQKALQHQSDWDLANLSYGDSCQALKMYECAANYYSKAKAEAPMWAWPERRLSGLHQPAATPSIAPITAAAPPPTPLPVVQTAPPAPTERADSRGPKIIEFSGRTAKGSCEFWILHWQVNGATSVKIDFNSRPIDIQPTDGQAGKVVKSPGHYELKATNSFGTAVRPLLLTVPPGAKPCN